MDNYLISIIKEYGETVRDSLNLIHEFGSTVQKDNSELRFIFDSSSVTSADYFYIDATGIYTNNLDMKSYLFKEVLYDEIKDIDDCKIQNLIFCKYKSLLPECVFSSGFENINISNTLCEELSSMENGYYFITLIKALYDALDWFDYDSQYKLKRFKNMQSKSGIEAENKTDLVSTNSNRDEQMDMSQTQANVTSDEKTKGTLTRNSVRVIIKKMRNLGAISPDFNDTELSQIVGELTGCKPEQVRKQFNAELPDKAKQATIEILEKIITSLKQSC